MTTSSSSSGPTRRGAPDHRHEDEAGAPAAGREAHRRRPAAHLSSPSTRYLCCSSSRAPTSRSSTGCCTRHHHRRAGRRGVHREHTEGFDDAPGDGQGVPARVAPRSAGVPADDHREAARAYATTRKAGDLLHAGHHRAHDRHRQRDDLANLALVTGHIGIARRRHEPAARAEQRAGRLRHGRACPTRSPATRACADPDVRSRSSTSCTACRCRRTMGLRIPEMLKAPSTATIKGMFLMGEDPCAHRRRRRPHASRRSRTSTSSSSRTSS